jgi:hypothetical protein
VREAVTLERLEYCILLDEDGNKRFIQGPAVVFPKPTESFVEKAGARKFRAIELNENSGIYLKVIAPYEENGALQGRRRAVPDGQGSDDLLPAARSTRSSSTASRRSTTRSRSRRARRATCSTG